MNKKRVTIYDIADALGMSASYVSRALNDHPAVSEKTRQIVQEKAKELRYKHDIRASNLRQGLSRTIGVVVPYINNPLFAEAISGVEETCFKNKYNLIVSQSHDSCELESIAVAALVNQNVECIIICIAAETHSFHQLDEIKNSNIVLIQFDRCLEELNSHKVYNNNFEAAYAVTNKLIQQGYTKVAFIGGPGQLNAFKDRKEGYLRAMNDSYLSIPYNFVLENALSREKVARSALELLSLKEPPDAFLTVTDSQALGVIETAKFLGIPIPTQLGIFGFTNENFSELMTPALSSVDLKSKEVGKRAAEIYFEAMQGRPLTTYVNEIVETEIKIRATSMR